MANNELVIDEEELPSPDERAELATEQENVKEMIQNSIQELNTYLVHAAQVGMTLEMREINLDSVTGAGQKRIDLIRAVAVVGFRREKI